MGSYLVIGMGRFGSAVATELHNMKHDVLVVDNHEENITDIVNHVTDVIIGDVKDETVLRSLGVKNFDCVIVSIADAMEDSILATIMLKEMGAEKIVCKAQNEWHSKILSQIGADKIIRPEYDMGKRVAHSLVQKNIIDYLDLSPDYSILEMTTPVNWIDKSISKIDLRRKYGVTLISVRNTETDVVNFSPNADTVLCKCDILTVLGSKRKLAVVTNLQ